MTSIYRSALGDDFAKLHPRVQERFAVSCADGTASIGTGVMEEIWRGPWWTIPFLLVGAWRRILLPIRGREVPFTIENYAYVDRFGRETVTWVRTFSADRARRFDATMIWSAQRGRIIDYLGTHQHLAVDIALSVSGRGGLRLTSGEQRFYEGPLAFRFPLAFSGIAEVEEWYDDDAGCYRIEVSVANRIWGPLFGYRGRFQADIHSCPPGAVPQAVKPLREERRE